MLNLFNLNLKNKNKKLMENQEKKSLKHFPSSVREWNNSIYVFNKNALNVIPVATTSAIKLIRSYFSLFNNRLERKMRKERLLLRLKRLSSNKIFVSNGEFKHTNNKVVITLYLFNRQKKNYLLKIRKQYLRVFNHFKLRLSKKISLMRYKGIESIKKANKDKYFLIKSLITNNSKNFYIKNSGSFSKYITKFYIKLLDQTSEKLKMYLYFKQLMYINKSKYNYVYLQYLKKHLEKLFSKNVEFNLVNLKRFYLNSDILSETITLKLTKNRKNIIMFLNNLKKKVKTQKKSLLLHIFLKKKKLDLKKKFNNKLYLKNFVVKNLKYRHVTGFRLEAKGRLTRRYTASRSWSKLRYKGNLRNIDSSFRGLSSVLLKGNLRSNLQFSKLNSKTRIGSFGIKGWVSGN